MDWSNLAYFAFVAAFVILMMRGCGGGMCGMGHRGRDNSRSGAEQRRQANGRDCALVALAECSGSFRLLASPQILGVTSFLSNELLSTFVDSEDLRRGPTRRDSGSQAVAGATGL